MTTIERHQRFLRWAELQFLFAEHANSALYSSLYFPNRLPTNKLAGYSYGGHVLTREELTLDFDDATLGAASLQHTVTFMLALVMRRAFQEVLPGARESDDPRVASALEISRLIRNAFSHSPSDPHWAIDPLCRDRVFEVEDIIQLDTHDLDGKRFDWHDYGGPLALYRLSEYVREVLLPSAAE